MEGIRKGHTMRYLWDHGKIRYRKTGDGMYAVIYDGKRQPGEVQRSVRWPGKWSVAPDHSSPFGPFETRKDAADNLLSYNRPSAAWIGPYIR